MPSNFIVYQLAKEFYQDSRKLKLKGELKDQFDRASLSVVLNIAEGAGKRSAVDQGRFYSIALGSLRECTAILDITNQLKERVELIDHLGAKLYILTRRR